MVKSLKTWLIISFSLIILICSIAFYTHSYTVNKTEEFEILLQELKRFQVCLLESNKIKEDIFVTSVITNSFYENSETKEEIAFKNKINSAKKSLQIIRKSSIGKKLINEAFYKNIEDSLNAYNALQKELFYLFRKKGYKDYGIEGLMRENAHDLISYNNFEIKYFALILRRHEKDFLIRKEREYIQKFSTAIKDIINLTHQNSRFSIYDKQYLFNRIYYYNKYFKLIARIENKIGIKGKNGLLNKSKNTFENIFNASVFIENKSKLEFEINKQSLKTTTIILYIIILGTLVLIIINFTNVINKSVNSITSTFTNYINSGFKFNSFQFEKSIIKEFNIIYLSFNEMAREINIYTNYFKEKVYERTKEINQKKDEILVQQKKIELQYQSLLNYSNELESQKLELKLKNEELNESLRYAKTIQRTLLPKSKLLNEYFSESFIFSKAKDVISGDFYCIFPINNSETTKIIVVAADCTGHGVPGSLISMLGLNTINNIVKVINIIDPGALIEKLDKEFSSFLTSGIRKGEVTDGMDIAAILFNPTTLELNYSIAKFTCFLYRNNKFLELNSSKKSVGYRFLGSNDKTFETNTIIAEKNDCLYLLSDGYADQFGGTNNKKYKRKNIQYLIEKIHLLPMNQQKEIFKKEFKNWKGKNKQTDDITIIGMKI